MFKKLLLIAAIMAMPFMLFGQSSGKIVGVVVDDNTSEPLPGVNVVLRGTLLGATTDVDGYYIILNVPVSTYTVEASYVGYAPVAVSNVRVSADVTTERNFKLQPTTLELEEAVVIIAERPLIEKHDTHSAVKVTSEDIVNAPIRGIQSFMAYMPSVTVQNNAVHIRGGRGEEVGYYLDGASTLNPMNRTNAIHVIQEAVEEMQVLTGGFGAEYGNANSGIVKTELRSGGQDFHFSLMGETDKFAAEGEQFLGTYSYRDHIIVGTASGSITNGIRFFIAAENQSVGDSKKRFSEGFTFNDRIDASPYNKNVTDGNPDTINLVYPNGFTPNNSYDRFAVNATLSFDISKSFRLRLSGVYNNTKQRFTNTPMQNMLETRWVDDINNHLLLSGKGTWLINSKSYVDLSLSYYYRSLDEEDPYFGNDWKKWADSSAVSQASGGAVTYRDAWRPQYNYLINGVAFTRPGGDEVYNKSKQTYLGGGLDYVNQITKHHEVKLGFSAKMYQIRQYSMDPLIMAYLDQDYGLVADHYGSIEDIPYNTVKSYMGNTYGYDVNGNETSGGLAQDKVRMPMEAAAYLSDRIEYKDLIINLGLRFDYFHSDDYTLKDPMNPTIDQNTRNVVGDEWVKKDAHMQVSPRLGISFPVSEKTVFYTQYGKFVQMPEFNDIYYNSYQYGRQIGGSFFYLSPIGFGMDPIYTTSYELGFRKQFGEFAALDIAGFYKNIQGQIMTTRVTPSAEATIASYNMLTNGDFATNKGLELTLNLRRYNRLQGSVNYTYTMADGTGSDKTGYISAVDRVSAVPTVLSPLDFSQAHRGNLILDYRFARNDGGVVFEQMGLNVMWRFSSGHPYTMVENAGGQSDAYTGGVDYMNDTRSRKAVEAINASTTPWSSNLDLRWDKSFNITDKLSANIYMRIVNLFNTKNVLNVYQQTGSDTDDGYITDKNQYEGNYNLYGGQDYLDLYNALNTKNGSSYLSELGLELWNTPRQIIFGLKINY